MGASSLVCTGLNTKVLQKPVYRQCCDVQNVHMHYACHPFKLTSYIFLYTSINHALLFSGAVEAGIAHGLKKRAAGLLPPQDTQSLLLKLTRLSEPAAELVRKLSGEDETNKDGSRNLSPGN